MWNNPLNVYFRLCFISCVLSFAACSSGPQIKEIANTADPSVEMERVSQNLNQAIIDQIDVLSPNNFIEAKDALETAKKARDNDKEQKEILHVLASSDAYLKRAYEVAKVSEQVLPKVKSERHNAISAGAQKILKKDFSDIDDDLKDVTKEIESNNLESAKEQMGKLEVRYSDIELKAIIKTNLGDAKKNFEQAKLEGAKNLTPNAYEWAEQRMTADENIIKKDRYSWTEVERASNDADVVSQRLLSLVRQAKRSSEQSPEEIAFGIEKNKNASDLAQSNSREKMRRSEDKLSRSNYDLERNKEQIGRLNVKNDQLVSEGELEKKYEVAREIFTNDEAEVSKQGNKLLIRLKGLSFPNGKSIILEGNYPLLTKVQKVIKDNNTGTVVVEGHTDSIGGLKLNAILSEKRAKAVEGYLTANNSIQSDRITTVGYGYSKPIASNKTKAGRTQNRRVDIVISTK